MTQVFNAGETGDLNHPLVLHDMSDSVGVSDADELLRAPFSPRTRTVRTLSSPSNYAESEATSTFRNDTGEPKTVEFTGAYASAYSTGETDDDANPNQATYEPTPTRPEVVYETADSALAAGHDATKWIVSPGDAGLDRTYDTANAGVSPSSTGIVYDTASESLLGSRPGNGSVRVVIDDHDDDDDDDPTYDTAVSSSTVIYETESEVLLGSQSANNDGSVCVLVRDIPTYATALPRSHVVYETATSSPTATAPCIDFLDISDPMYDAGSSSPDQGCVSVNSSNCGSVVRSPSGSPNRTPVASSRSDSPNRSPITQAVMVPPPLPAPRSPARTRSHYDGPPPLPAPRSPRSPAHARSLQDVPPPLPAPRSPARTRSRRDGPPPLPPAGPPPLPPMVLRTSTVRDNAARTLAVDPNTNPLYDNNQLLQHVVYDDGVSREHRQRAAKGSDRNPAMVRVDLSDYDAEQSSLLAGHAMTHDVTAATDTPMTGELAFTGGRATGVVMADAASSSSITTGKLPASGAMTGSEKRDDSRGVTTDDDGVCSTSL